MKPETEAIHNGYQIDPTSGALTPPLHLSTTFERDADGSYPHGHVYTRDTNPNRAELETRLATLEQGAQAFAFASGMAAITATVMALSHGDHVIAPQTVYFQVRVMLTEMFGRWGLQATFVDMGNLDAIKQAVQANTRLIMIETPSNPMLSLTDISAVAEIAHRAGAILLCDNTIGTPIFQQPLALGADIVVHATTKYLGGHSDVLGGALIVKETNAISERISQIQKIGGAVPSPFDCWLLMRGIFTLPHRLKAIQTSALQIAQFLQNHPKIESVLHPFLPTHADYELAQRQMSGHSGLFSFLVKGGMTEAMQVAANLNLIIRATSFGGVHTTIEHRASVEAVGTTTPPNLLRLSVGLEHVDDLIADLEQALGS